MHCRAKLGNERSVDRWDAIGGSPVPGRSIDEIPLEGSHELVVLIARVCLDPRIPLRAPSISLFFPPFSLSGREVLSKFRILSRSKWVQNRDSITTLLLLLNQGFLDDWSHKHCPLLIGVLFWNRFVREYVLISWCIHQLDLHCVDIRTDLELKDREGIRRLKWLTVAFETEIS
jgi:hypothetical protein